MISRCRSQADDLTVQIPGRVQELACLHVVQILAQLLECRSGLSVAYESLFPPLLLPAMWERQGNIPALVRLLCAYMTKVPRGCTTSTQSP